MKLDRDATSANTLVIMRRDYRILYVSFEENTLFMVQATDALVRKGYKPTQLYAIFFNENVNAVLDELHV